MRRFGRGGGFGRAGGRRIDRPREPVAWLLALAVAVVVAGVVAGRLEAGSERLGATVRPLMNGSDELEMEAEAAGQSAPSLARTADAPVAAGGDAVADEGSGAGAAEPAPNAPGTLPTGQAAPAVDRKVVRNATIALTVGDVDAAAGHARGVASEFGGVVFSAATEYYGERKHGQLVLQVPFDCFEAALARLREAPTLVTIDGETTSSQDVTQEYVDADARVRNLEATEQGLLTLMDRAGGVGEVISVYDKLSPFAGRSRRSRGG